MIQFDWHPMEQKLQQVFYLLAFGEFMVAQFIPFASEIALFLIRESSFNKGLPL